jgi:RNA polymerase sigma-70 factor, ECF subfamily
MSAVSVGRDRVFRHVYDQNVDFVRNRLRRLGTHPDDLEDLVQEVFVVVHRRFAELTFAADFRGWLHAVALGVRRNHARAWLRRLRQSTGPVEHVDVESIADHDRPDAEDGIWRREIRSLLGKGLCRLSSEQRRVFVLSFHEGLSVTEIARLTGDSPNTISSRLKAARKKVRLSSLSHLLKSVADNAGRAPRSKDEAAHR